jgi:hypothetical protein
MDNQLRNLLLNNYERSFPSKKDTEDFISNFHQYRKKKQAERKTNFLAILLLAIVTVCGFSIILKETNNKLDIQTSSGEFKK